MNHEKIERAIGNSYEHPLTRGVIVVNNLQENRTFFDLVLKDGSQDHNVPGFNDLSPMMSRIRERLLGLWKADPNIVFEDVNPLAIDSRFALDIIRKARDRGDTYCVIPPALEADLEVENEEAFRRIINSSSFNLDS